MQTMTRLLSQCFALSTGLATIGWDGAAAQTAEPPTIIVVFDGSGSMWGRMAGDKDSKLNLAREAIRRAVPKVAATTRVGLAGFGHRRRADCSDTEVILPPEPADLVRIMAPLEKYNPRGKGPIVNALKDTAATLAKGTGPSSLILIHDDLDNCQQDPCAAVDELAKANPRLAVHVISIAMAREDSQRMACVTRATGGRHFEPQDTAALGAAIEDAFKLGNTGVVPPQPAGAATAAPRPGSVPAAAAVSPPPVVAKAAPVAVVPPVEDTGPPGLRLSATLGPGGPAVIVPLTWKLSRAGDDAGAVPVASARGATLDLALAAGSYVVEVQHNLVSAREAIEVKPRGATRVAVALAAGAVRVSAVLQKATPALEHAVFAISDVPAAGSPARTVWTGGADAPPIFLPVGIWRVSAELDRARVERQVTVTAGSMVDTALVLGAGRLRVKAIDRDGGPPLDRVYFQVTEDDADSPNGRREVARSTAQEPEFTLSAGTYYISARHGQTEVRERVLVNAGDDVARTLMVAQGRLNLQSRIAGSGALLDAGVTYSIDRVDGTLDQLRNRSATARLELPAGQYRIVSQLGGQNARIAREVEIKTGQQTNLNFDHVVANVQLKIGAGRAAGVDIFWDVRDARGTVVWQTVLAEPRAYLAAGRYKVTAESRDRRGSVDVEVKGGEMRVVEVPLE